MRRMRMSLFVYQNTIHADLLSLAADLYCKPSRMESHAATVKLAADGLDELITVR
jgi:hypothetical protein